MLTEMLYLLDIELVFVILSVRFYNKMVANIVPYVDRLLLDIGSYFSDKDVLFIVWIFIVIQLDVIEMVIGFNLNVTSIQSIFNRYQ